MSTFENMSYDELLELAQKKGLIHDADTEWGAVGKYIERTATEEPDFDTSEMAMWKMFREVRRLRSENAYLRSMVKKLQPKRAMPTPPKQDMSFFEYLVKGGNE